MAVHCGGSPQVHTIEKMDAPEKSLRTGAWPGLVASIIRYMGTSHASPEDMTYSSSIACARTRVSKTSVIGVSLSLGVSVSVRPLVCLSVCPPVRPPVGPSSCRSYFCPSARLSVSVYASLISNMI